jgi:hypothetical protein
MAVSATFRTNGGGGMLGAIYTVDWVSRRRTPFGRTKFSIIPAETDRTASYRTEFFEIATRFGPSGKLLYRFLRHLFPGVTLEPGE